MIREQRSRTKLASYYSKYMEEGVIDPNVHPWVAESWQKSRENNVSTKAMSTVNYLSAEQLALYQQKHSNAIEYLEEFSQQIREFFQSYNLSLLLIDADNYVLKSYSLPFYQKTPGELRV